MTSSRLRRVGVNLLYLVPGETGGSEVYARRLLPKLPQVRPDLEFVAFVNRAGLDVIGPELRDAGISVVPLRSAGRNRLLRTVAEQLALPLAVRSRHLDVLHGLATTAPAFPGATSVVTILDVIYAIHPQAHTPLMRAGMRVLVPLAARRAKRVIAISHSAAGEIGATLSVPEERIDVVHLGGREPGPFTPEREVRDRLALGDARVVLSVSARRPHKNLARLLEAFAAVGDPSAQLVLPGYPTSFDDELAACARRLGIEQRVRFLGWVSEPDLEGLYAIAACFVFPSLAEGFGLPVLEAMQRGVPVACSNASSLPEVAGDAARYFDPLDVGEITQAIDELLGSPRAAARLAASGKERASRFSWERAARETIASYERALES